MGGANGSGLPFVQGDEIIFRRSVQAQYLSLAHVKLRHLPRYGQHDMSPNISTASGKPALDFLDWLEGPAFIGNSLCTHRLLRMTTLARRPPTRLIRLQDLGQCQ